MHIAAIDLEDALFALRPTARAAADRLDRISPESSEADIEVVRWLASGIEALARDAESYGAKKGLAAAGERLADRAARLVTSADIRAARRACDAIERRVKAVIAAYGGLPYSVHAGIAVPPAGQLP